eukprot:TRINITY_DN12641_c0_g1_i1.p1 TRINITY_DN12641_c0_g1~~TRINITY_DN12641_c0_g1_i1.p1  ORF type:complete len:535 (+),score=118.91 TRINITY_DN12641_c0_g1_i1:378-1982(+)
MVIGNCDPIHVVQFSLAPLTLSVILTDWSAAAGASLRTWSYMVLMVDLCLVVRVSRATTVSCVAATLLWLFVERVESCTHFGMYGAAGLGQGDLDTEVCDCASPPCIRNAFSSVAGFVQPSLVFVADFVLTRGFAKETERQLHLMRCAIDLTASITSSLSRYETEEAEHHLQSDQVELLPADLVESLGMLVTNLHTYRAFLPQSCLPAEVHNDDGPQHSSVFDVAPAPVNKRSIRSLGARDDQSDSSCSSSASPRGRKIELTGAMRTPLQVAHATLVVANANGLLRIGNKPHQLEFIITGMVEHCTAAATSTNGMVELVSGDHRFVSFNASRVCLGHRKRGLLCAWALTDADGMQLSSRAAVATGECTVGDFGTDKLRRFMIVGKPTVAASIYQKLAVQLRARVLLDARVEADAKEFFHCRLVCHTLCEKLFGDAVQALYVATEEREPLAVAAAEWMYEMEERGPGKWDEYNSSQRIWLQGMVVQALECLERGIVRMDDDESTLATYKELKMRIGEHDFASVLKVGTLSMEWTQ